MSVIQILRRVFRVNYFGLISFLVLLTKVFTTACLKRQKEIMVYHHFITDVCCLVAYFVVNCIVVLNMQGANI